MDRLFGHPPGEIVGTSEARRLKRWAEAFETWLERRERAQGVKVRRWAELAWEELLSFTQKQPWEITRNAVQAWVDAQVREGRSASTIQGRLTAISKFYQTIHEWNEHKYEDHDIWELKYGENEDRGADLGRGIGDALVNPVVGVQRPQPAPRQGDPSALSAKQVAHLLHALRDLVPELPGTWLLVCQSFIAIFLISTIPIIEGAARHFQFSQRFPD